MITGLPQDQAVECQKYVEGGKLITNVNPSFKWTEDYVLMYSVTKEYAANEKTAYSSAVSSLVNDLKRKLIKVARQNNVPQDLTYVVQEGDMDSQDDAGCYRSMGATVINA